jgi:multiple sugar transport system permease protein
MATRTESTGRATPATRFSREEIETGIAVVIKWVVIIFFTVITVFPFYWMLNLSLRTEGDVVTNPTRLVPRMEDIEQNVTAIGCYIRYRTDDPEENPNLPERCQGIFPRSSFTYVLERGFPNFIRNSVVVSLLTVALTLLLAIPASYAITRLQFRGRSLMSWGILLIYMFPAIVLAIPLFVVFTRLGLRGTLHGLLIVYLSGTLPVALYMLRSYFITVPPDLEEAAMIDGCTQLSALIRVTLPLAMPAIASVGLYTFMIAWNEFLYAFIMLTGLQRDLWTLPLGLQQLNNQEVPVTALMAGSLIVSVPIIVIFFGFERFLTRGLTAGAVKG